ncbi:hypothetical protein HJFPF1_13508 [Paramyrothecium foliicola]|nr:hypothetical protein HJFPF1_13508 [Paramyrothecium foliicola]
MAMPALDNGHRILVNRKPWPDKRPDDTFVTTRPQYRASTFLIKIGQSASVDQDFLDVHRLLFKATYNHALPPEEAIKSVHSWLLGKSGSWLFIFYGTDELDDSDGPNFVDVVQYIPGSPRIDVLGTTRSSTAQDLSIPCISRQEYKGASPARDQALTSRNIRAGWPKAGLFPFNPDRVLCDVSKPPTDLIALQASEVNAVSCLQDHVPQTPFTPVSAEAVASLHKLIEQDLYMLDEMNRPRLEKHLQKLTHAAQLSFAERSLLQENNQFLAQMNNEAKVRRSTKSEILGRAKVMSYEDLENALAMRASKEAAKEAKRAEKDAKRVTHSLKLKQAPLGKKNRGRKTKNHGTGPEVAPVKQPTEQEISILGHVVWTCEAHEQGEVVRSPSRAPIAPM